MPNRVIGECTECAFPIVETGPAIRCACGLWTPFVNEKGDWTIGRIEDRPYGSPPYRVPPPDSQLTYHFPPAQTRFA